MSIFSVTSLHKCKWLLITALVLLTGCANVVKNDNWASTATLPRSILVIPPMNNSVDVEAPYTYISTISRPLAEKGYYVFPVAVIDNFLKQNGLPTPAEMHSIPLDKIQQHIGADAVLYVTIEDWGQKFLLLTSTTVVHAKLKLVDAKTGALLWSATAKAQQSSGDGGGGLTGALINAVVDQVVKTIADRTPEISRLANTTAVNNANNGLPDGPYRKQFELKNHK